jgi:hypothetical protein
LAGDDAPPCTEVRVGATPLQRLSSRELLATLSDLVQPGLPVKPVADAPLVTALLAEQYMEMAETVSAAVAAALPTFLPCDPAQGQPSCAEQFIRSFGARAYRRPLDNADAFLRGYFDAGAADDGFQGGVEVVVQLMLQSPNFLYRVERGAEPVGPHAQALTPHELAVRLSYSL